MFQDTEDDPLLPAQDRFFVPSYLASSNYVQKLEEAHKLKANSSRDPKHSTTDGSSSNGTGFSAANLPPGSHRGLSHTVVERPPFDDDDALAPLPTRWNKSDMWGGLDLQPDGLGVKYLGPKGYHERDHEACAVRANHHMPPQCGIYYYEVHILAGKRDEYVPPLVLLTPRAFDISLN